MNRFLLMLTGAGSLLFLATGCGSPLSCEESDIPYSELEARQMKAVDPIGRFAAAQSSIMRQEIVTEHGLLDSSTVQMVEVKFKDPDKFCLTTFDDNQPVCAVILNGDQAWMAFFDNKKVEKLDSEATRKIKIMQQLATPDAKLSDIFKEIKIERCTLEGGLYYRLTCANPGMNPMELFVDANDYLPKRIKGVFKVEGGENTHYESYISRYRMYEGVRIPDESVVIQDGVTQKYKVVYYKLDVPIPDDEFRPPVF